MAMPHEWAAVHRVFENQLVYNIQVLSAIAIGVKHAHLTSLKGIPSVQGARYHPKPPDF